jgi:cell division protein FtsQ
MSRLVAAVRVGERRWNLQLRGGITVKLPEGHEAASIERLVTLQQDHALLDRPLDVVDLRLPDRLVLRPHTEPTADATSAKKPT